MDWHGAQRMLMKEYGRSGEKAAFEMARTGNDGGLYAVMRAIGRGMAEEAAEAEIAARIQDFLDRLSPDEQIAVAREYISKFGRLLPSELTEGSAARVVANFPKVLQEHPRLMQRTRRVGW